MGVSPPSSATAESRSTGVKAPTCCERDGPMQPVTVTKASNLSSRGKWLTAALAIAGHMKSASHLLEHAACLWLAQSWHGQHNIERLEVVRGIY